MTYRSCSFKSPNKMKQSRQTPNILKKPSKTRPKKIPTVPTPPQNIVDLTSWKDIEVLLFDQTDSETEEIENDPLKSVDSDIEGKNRKEIVVGSKQRFRLQEFPIKSVETNKSSQDVSDKPSGNVSIKKDLYRASQNELQPVQTKNNSKTVPPLKEAIKTKKTVSQEVSNKPQLNQTENNVDCIETVKENFVPIIIEQLPSSGTRIRVTEKNDTKEAASTSVAEPTIDISICRTCLKPVPPNVCHKLFATNRNSYDLRRKLSGVIGPIDFRASLNPVVCMVCYEAIQVAHALQKRAKFVEEQINRRKIGTVPVDLKEVLAVVAREGLGRTKSTPRVAEPDLETYLEKRKRIIHTYISSLDCGDPPLLTRPEKDRHSMAILKDILLDSVQNDNSVPIPKLKTDKTPTVPNSTSNLRQQADQKLKSAEVNDFYMASILAGSVPISKSSNTNRPSTVPNLELSALRQKMSNHVLKSTTKKFQTPAANAIHVPNVESRTHKLSTVSNRKIVPNLGRIISIVKPTVSNAESSASNVKKLACVRKLIPSNIESFFPNLESPTSNTKTSHVKKPPSRITKPSNISSGVPKLEPSAPNSVGKLISLNVESRSNPKSTVPQLVSCVPNLEYSFPNQDSIVPNRSSALPRVASSVPNVGESAYAGKGIVSVIESPVPYLESSVSDVESAPSGSCKRSKVQKSRTDSLDAVLVTRRTRQWKMSGLKSDIASEVPEVTTQRVKREERKKRSKEAYDYLFNAKNSKKKPKVPLTNDLFDEEHDRYFENLEGKAGCFMVRKWKRFAELQPVDGPPYLCEICGMVFPSRWKLKRHSDHHKGEDIGVCPHCGVQIKTDLLKKHIVAHHRPPQHECKDCLKKFHLKANLAKHVRHMHKYAGRRFSCHICGPVLRKTYLGWHMKKHDPTKTYPCKTCKKVFRSQVGWLIHRRRHSSKAKSYACGICSKPMKSQVNLKKHLRLYHEGGETKTCHVCGKVFSTKQSMKKHVHGLKSLRREKGRLTKKRTSEVEQAPKFVSEEAGSSTSTVAKEVA